MKKKWLPLVMLFCFSVGFIGGCKNDDTKSVERLNINGEDIVLKVGDKKYSANELFSDILETTAGADEVYEKILKMVVESTIEVDANMTASWELMEEAFEEEVETYAYSNGISDKEARKALLAEEGYSSVEEKKDAYLYEVRLSKLQEKYWKETKNNYFEEYLEKRLPYYVKQILVKVTYNSDRGPYSTIISDSVANNLYKVYEMLVEGYKFSYIMGQISEDSVSNTAVGYHMDLTTSFVSEFLYGVIVFDALLNNEASKVQGLTSNILNYYAGVGGGHNFNVINASDIIMLGSTSGNNVDNSLKTYEGTGEDEKDVSTITNAYGTSFSLYTRTIIYNQTFNNPGISVIAYDLEENVPENVKTIKINGKDKKVLTDENGNIVFAVCSQSYGVHFLTVNVSPFDENVKLFYSMDQEATINEMVEEKKQTLKNEGKTDDDIAAILETYREELESYKTYVDLKGGEKQTDRNTVIEEIEGYVETYAKRGITSGVVAGENQYLTYDMVEYYMNEGKITIENEEIKKIVTDYINAQRELIDLSSMNEIVSGWSSYYDELSITSSKEIVSKKVPMECSAGVAGDKDYVCKYNYETGFEIIMTYEIDSDVVMPEEYVKSYHIGDDKFDLPIPTRNGYTFDGWYTTKDSTDGIKVESIDATKTSTNNKIHVYARWSANNE